MSKQTDLINIPDSITVSGSNVGINEQSPDRQLHITDASEVNVKLEAGADISEIRLKDSDNALTVHLNNNERMGLKSDEVNWTNSTSGFFNKIWGPSSGDISSGVMTYRGSTARGGFYTNPTHGLTILSEVDISLRANNANRLHIDTSGRVTKPYQPSFKANYAGSSYNIAASTKVTHNREIYDVGGVFDPSNSRFTAPVAGKYVMLYQQIVRGSYSNAWTEFYINGGIATNQGGRVHFSFNSGTLWNTVYMQHIFDLSANDYIEVFNGAVAVDYHGNDWHSWSGYLLG